MVTSLANELYSEILEPKVESDLPSVHHIKQFLTRDGEDEEWFGDGSSWNVLDEKVDPLSDLDREWQRRKIQFLAIGYRDGIIAGKEASAQQGFNIGFKESVLVGFNWGLVRGVTGALHCLTDELREKIIDSPETRNKFHSLYESVNNLSTTDALKAFDDGLSKRVVKQNDKTTRSLPREQHADYGVVDSCYRQLQSLIVESPAIEVQLRVKAVSQPAKILHLNEQTFPNQEWIQSVSLPVDYCDNYGVCGPYGSCNTVTSPNCGCLKGFEKNSNKTSPANDTSVCRRRIALDCGNGEGFLKFPSMKLPDTENAVFNPNMSIQNCKIACKNNCSCTAYAKSNITKDSAGCLLWFGALIDVRVYQQNGQDLYVRLAASEISDLHSSSHKKVRVVMEVTLSIAAVLTLSGLMLAFYTRRKWKKRSDAERKGSSSNQMGGAEVPLFSLSKLARATNDFSVDNKLGEGGFGSVYKGVLEEGQEIAVKRLSKSSRQGLDEFKNEVICIAKLQHRNLVKLLGYCIKKDEKMLIYEYMANKSLDGFLFDESKRLLLDWSQRFHIIHGIARGLLYLHHDSRLKVVHRDLKAGNILLDHHMRPKISDFGLARMFNEDVSEANTKRIVGTLGYISPEYAGNGHYSVKSDIFSFGVLVLEIVSGKKNRGFVHEDHADNLLGHAWRLYNEGKSLDLIDECLRPSCNVCEVFQSVHVGLLCVQQRVEDRPNTSSVVAMLCGEGSLPSPKKPAFFIQEGEVKSTTILSSLNGVTLSQVDAR